MEVIESARHVSACITIVVAMTVTACRPQESNVQSAPSVGRAPSASAQTSKPSTASTPAGTGTPATIERRVTPRSIRPTPTRLTVLVDTSASMDSYGRTLKSTLHHLLTDLHTAAGVQGITSFQAARFAESVDALQPVSGPTEVLGWHFNAPTTCLPSPLRTVIADANSSQSVVYAILTDGVPSASPPGSKCGCGNKIDINCIAEQMHEIVRAGYGVWLIGTRSDFSGTYFSEMKPGPLAVKAAQRPIYVWLLSQNVSVGRAIARHIVPKASDTGFAAELWPGRWSGFELSAVRSAAEFGVPPSLGQGSQTCGDPMANAQIQAFASHAESGGPVMQVTLGSPSKAKWWLLRIPARAYSDDLGGLVPLLTVTGERPHLESGAHILWQDKKDPSIACLALDGAAVKPGVWVTTWRIAVDTAFLEQWSTADDTATSQIGKTLLLEELWTNVGQRIRGAGGTIDVPVVRVVGSAQP